MRIATYNLWNASFAWGERLAAIVDALTALDADLVAIQEAPTQVTATQPFADYFRERTRYLHVLHLPYPGEPEVGERPEGLAFLSRSPFQSVRSNWENGEATANSWAARVVVGWQGGTLGVTNVHLDWQSAACREQQLVRIVQDLAGAPRCDHDVLCGDFNDDVDSRVGRYLAGEASIEGQRTRWRDLAQEWHAAQGAAAPATIGFLAGNPRSRVYEPDGVTGRFDRIYLRSQTASQAPPIVQAGLFGDKVAGNTGSVPSDHYGVFVDLDS